MLWQTLEQWQSRAGLGNSPRPMLDERGRIQCSDVVLALAEDPRRKLRIRCVARPDQAQALLVAAHKHKSQDPITSAFSAHIR